MRSFLLPILAVSLIAASVLLRAQDLRAQDLRAQDLRAQDLRAQDLRAQDLRAQGGKGEEKAAYTMKWSTTWTCKEEARKARYGILYYFPPDEAEADHEVFQNDELMAQSLRSPFVRVNGEDRETLVDLYQIDPKSETIVVTDWYGNEIKKFEVNKRRKVFPVEEMIKLIQDCGEYEKVLRAKVQKALKSGEKQFEKERYPQALKELLPASKMSGFPECEKAREIVEEIEDRGRRELAKLSTLKVTDKDAAISELKKIVKDFEGSDVAKAAEQELKELGG